MICNCCHSLDDNNIRSIKCVKKADWPDLNWIDYGKAFFMQETTTSMTARAWISCISNTSMFFQSITMKFCSRMTLGSWWSSNRSSWIDYVFILWYADIYNKKRIAQNRHKADLKKRFKTLEIDPWCFIKILQWIWQSPCCNLSEKFISVNDNINT